jgi:glycosyltransferase involved in cell wall biosynthesis
LHLHLAGATHPEARHQSFLRHCKALAQGLPVSFHTDISGEEMQAQLAAADLCWHGTGLGVDVAAEPWALEHFGIAVLEGMAQGALCFALAAGGPAKILSHGETGYLFHDEDELVSLSLAAIEAWDSAQIMAIRRAATIAVQAHAPEVMAASWQALAAELLGDVPTPATGVPS